MEDAYTIPYGRNSYCGPAALAYVLRSDPDRAAQRLREVTGKRSIKGLSNHDLLKTMHDLGVSYSSFIEDIKRPTLLRWIDKMPSGEYIVNITDHYIVVHDEVVFDNRFHLGKSIHACPYLRCRVKAAWRIERSGITWSARLRRGTSGFPDKKKRGYQIGSPFVVGSGRGKVKL